MNFNNSYLSRSRSKDMLNNSYENCLRNTSRPKSTSQRRTQILRSPACHRILDDFESKRQFFENQAYTNYTPTSINNNNNYSLLNSNKPKNDDYQRHTTK